MEALKTKKQKQLKQQDKGNKPKMRKLTSFITETFWAVTHHNLY